MNCFKLSVFVFVIVGALYTRRYTMSSEIISVVELFLFRAKLNLMAVFRIVKAKSN